MQPAHAISLVILIGPIAAAGWGSPPLRTRRDIPVPAGEITAVDAQGVTVGTGAGATVVPWDSVAAVPEPWTARAEPFAPIAEDAWRARTRLERGDLAGAEPLLERLFPAYSLEKGPTAQLVTGGLLMCRLARGAQASSIAPWLAYLMSIEGVETRRITRGGYVADPADLTPIDSETRLAPMLPPIWLSGPGVQSLARQPWPQASGRAGLLSALYEQSARSEAQLPVSLPPRPADDEGAEMVWDIVASRAGDQVARAAARDRLRNSLDTSPAPWKQAWIRTALGRSLLMEPDTELQLLGIAEIATVPAALERVCPYLTGVALAEISLGALRHGDTRQAVAIRARLAERFPGHPALDWEPLRHWTYAPEEASRTPDTPPP